jgi:hypothetical protein
MPVIMLLTRSAEGVLVPAAASTAIPAAAAMVIPRVAQLQEGLFQGGSPGRQLGGRGVGQQLSPADHHQVVGHQGRLADQVAGDQHRPALGGQ